MSSSLFFRISTLLNQALVDITALLCACWLVLIWRRTRDTAYLWMMLAIGAMPLALHGLRVAYRPLLKLNAFDIYGPRGVFAWLAFQYVELLLWIATAACFYIALSRMASGCVQFRDLFRRLEGPDSTESE